jgi:uncharacterized membrane protein
MSVHVPLTCMLLAPFADAAAIFLHRADLWALGALATAGAVLFGVLAATLGALDFERAHAKAPKTVIWHASAMSAAVTCEAISLAGRMHSDGALNSPPALWAIVASAGAFLIVLAGAYLGGELVYHHGVNVGPEQKP